MISIVNDLRVHAGEQPDATIYTFLDGAGRVTETFTYRQFEERTNFVSAALLEQGVLAPGDRVLLVYPPGLEFIVAFFACVKLGAVPIPVPPADGSGFIGGLERLAHVAADAGTVVALTTAGYDTQLRALAERSPEGAAWLRREPLSRLAWLATDALQGALASFESRERPLLFLQYTSGSTQYPRGVMVSHANVVHNAWVTVRHRPIAVSWLPHYHDMGLIGYFLYPMITGGSSYWLSGASFLKRPLLWLDILSRYRATITSSPNFGYEYCLRDDKVPPHALSTLDLRSMVCMMNASEPVRASTYERFQAKFGPCGLSPKAHVVYYGLAENTLSVTGGGRVPLTVNTSLMERHHLRIEPRRDDQLNQSTLVSCGRPLAGIDVRIVELSGRAALGEDRIGEIWVGGESKTGGYLNKPVLSEEVFHARVEGEACSPEYLRTGDVGFIHDDELFVCGRLKDMMIIGGRNYYPADIEGIVEEASSKVRPGCVAAFAVDRGADGEGIAVIAEAKRANDLPDLDALSRAIRTRCQVEVDVIALVPHGTITKTSSGKIARQRCRRDWDLGEVKPIASRVKARRTGGDAILQDLLERIAMDGYDARTLADLGVDSLTLVELSLHLEAIFAARGAGRVTEAWSDLRILQAVTVGELRAVVAALEEGEDLPDIAPELLADRLASLESEEVAAMRQDARLPPDVVVPPARVAGAGSLLVTGATGFLGSFILEALLRLTDRPVVTLVRASDTDHARARTASALERTGLFDERLRAAFESRVRAVPGDLACPQLGLHAAGWETLAGELSAVYHCGADVDYVSPYATLRETNVMGTREVIRLASAMRPKTVHYASTTFMFGFVARETCWESDQNLEMAGLNFGYAQSKWVAEQLVYEAIGRGLPARVYRPSLITASGLGRYVRGDLMARILSYMIRHGLSIESDNQLSFVPVDVCATNIVALSLRPDLDGAVFHITANDYYTIRTVCSLIAAQSGYAFDYLPFGRFMDYINAHCPKADPMFPLLAFFNQNWPRIDRMRDKRYNSAQYRAARETTPLAVAEPPLEQIVGSIVTFLQQENLVPAPPQRLGVA